MERELTTLMTVVRSLSRHVASRSVDRRSVVVDEVHGRRTTRVELRGARALALHVHAAVARLGASPALCRRAAPPRAASQHGAAAASLRHRTRRAGHGRRRPLSSTARTAARRRFARLGLVARRSRRCC